jgi:hypothetical protein
MIGALAGTLNTAGSTVLRRDGEGHLWTYSYDSARGSYVSKEGGGAYDEIVWDASKEKRRFTSPDIRRRQASGCIWHLSPFVTRWGVYPDRNGLDVCFVSSQIVHSNLMCSIEEASSNTSHRP